jgi:hypothetical protein
MLNKFNDNKRFSLFIVLIHIIQITKECKYNRFYFFKPLCTHLAYQILAVLLSHTKSSVIKLVSTSNTTKHVHSLGCNQSCFLIIFKWHKTKSYFKPVEHGNVIKPQ